MKELKQIERIFKRPANPGMVGDGFRVYNYFPGGYPLREKLSPFLMLDFNPAFDFGVSDKPRGVDVHPHKGFETVTIAYKGSVEHYDSTGNSGVINPGDVQWMTAGAGILHKEFHEREFSKKGGLFEMIQLWVNLPKKNKLAPPKYQALVSSKMNKVVLPGDSGVVNVIAGNMNDVTGSASTFTDINLFDIRLHQNGIMETSIPAVHNTAILIVEGSAEINGQNAGTHDLVLFKNDGGSVTINAHEMSVMLLLSGEPINEPIAQYGPFVMNTQLELQETLEEYKAGKFGVLN